MKKFSICIPNYNYANFIGETIESVLAQTFTDYEICIADNCSTDNSWEVIQQYVNKYSHIKAIRNNFNLGFAGNLDKVSQLAEGEWHIMLSSDDLMLPTALEEYNKVIAQQQHNPRILINSSVLQFDNDNPNNTIFIGPRRKVWPTHFTSPNGEIITQDTSTLLRNGILNFLSPYHFVSLCYHRSAYANCGGYEASRIQNPDKWFHWKLSVHTDTCIYINKVLFKYRWHNSNQLSIQNKTGVLRYWLDEFRNCYEIGAPLLTKANLNKNQVEHAFLDRCLNNYIGSRLLKLNLLEAVRLWGYGLFTYPKKFVTKPAFWMIVLLFVLPLAAILLIVW